MTAQTPNSVSGIPRDNFKRTLNYKAESDINEISSTLLFSRTFLVTESQRHIQKESATLRVPNRIPVQME